jgi:predicted TIM-barrel fold metal-dependent hydrolase
MLEHLGMNDHLLFSTDYPHWDFDSPDHALPSILPPAVRQAIRHDNACALYRLKS